MNCVGSMGEEVRTQQKNLKAVDGQVLPFMN